jgi:hypothetical protein
LNRSRSNDQDCSRKPLVIIPHTLSELTGPMYGHGDLGVAS